MISRKISSIGTPEKYIDRLAASGALVDATAYYTWRVPKNGIIKRIDLDLESSTGAAPVVNILGLNAAVLATVTINEGSQANTQKSVDTNISVGATDRILVEVTTAGTSSNLRVGFVFQET